jgi:hypothetical protein
VQAIRAVDCHCVYARIIASEVSECMEATEKRIGRRGGNGDYNKRRFGGTESTEVFEDKDVRAAFLLEGLLRHLFLNSSVDSFPPNLRFTGSPFPPRLCVLFSVASIYSVTSACINFGQSTRTSHASFGRAGSPDPEKNVPDSNEKT